MIFLFKASSTDLKINLSKREINCGLFISQLVDCEQEYYKENYNVFLDDSAKVIHLRSEIPNGDEF